jgi:hypothetical protein
VRSNITAYLRDELGVPAGEVEALTLKLYLEHGTTMAGLVATGHTIDFDHFHSKAGTCRAAAGRRGGARDGASKGPERLPSA